MWILNSMSEYKTFCVASPFFLSVRVFTIITQYDSTGFIGCHWLSSINALHVMGRYISQWMIHALRERPISRPIRITSCARKYVHSITHTRIALLHVYKIIPRRGRFCAAQISRAMRCILGNFTFHFQSASIWTTSDTIVTMPSKPK